MIYIYIYIYILIDGARRLALGSRRQGLLLAAPPRCLFSSRFRAKSKQLKTCSGFRVQGSGCRVQGPGSRVQGPGSRVQGPGGRVHLRLEGWGSTAHDGSHSVRAAKDYSSLPHQGNLGNSGIWGWVLWFGVEGRTKGWAGAPASRAGARPGLRVRNTRFLLNVD